MNRCFVDTNLFIRYLTNDDPAKADRVEKLLDDAARGDIALVTTEMVMAEVVWVLESAYGLKSIDVSPLIRGILATPGLEVINAPLVSRGLEFYETHSIDFIDGYIAAVMEKQGITELYSFDRKHVSRLKTITRKEP
ncbi:type II toxin-antitoxin system VapC family toxin [Geobacter hydrogenophilus]|uniref:Ribonuclease VapC n=1 Tax=Geobacter hydrogenophilus TaxID=40983 RepID=A0A9W6LAF3_9BACT|nr:type II toxin-antitoxin system VapC family toxin [Geobacter hydrogenophilus]MBT0894592.1 type II toxin-antitoxin system VapC family toxin [Geobacter hydrogenophilus]GLI37213.1 pilus biogenesis protein [Geobacter hydrogenophilus]